MDTAFEVYLPLTNTAALKGWRPSMPEVAAFVGISVLLAYISRSSLRSPRSHGFYRFFAWESLLAVILLPSRRWFYRPLSPNQLTSWLLRCCSNYLAIVGFRLLHQRGKPEAAPQDKSLIGWKKRLPWSLQAFTFTFATRCIARYLSLAGAHSSSIPLYGFALAAIASAFLFATARIEEGENIHYFGEVYRQYRQQTRMSVPFLF
jgi:hypothetical protein